MGTLQGILFISVRGININVFVRPESEQQQRKKQPCHNAILPASSTAFTNRAARDQPAHPPAPSTYSLSSPCRAVPKAAFATALALCVASAFLFTCQTVFCRNKNLSRFYGHKKQVENGESPSPSPSPSQSHSRVEVFVLELSFEFCSAVPRPPHLPLRCLSRSVNSEMQSEGKNYNSLAKSFHFSGDFVVSTWHSYADKGKGKEAVEKEGECAGRALSRGRGRGGVVKNWKVYLNFNLFRKRLKSFRY